MSRGVCCYSSIDVEEDERNGEPAACVCEEGGARRKKNNPKLTLKGESPRRVSCAHTRAVLLQGRVLSPAGLDVRLRV